MPDMNLSQKQENKKQNLRGLPVSELTPLVTGAGEPPYRAVQLFKWIHCRGALTFDEMSDLPKRFRVMAASTWDISTLTVSETRSSSDGTIKYRLGTTSGDFIEAVYMPSDKRNTLCVSTQVGCAMGCDFCLTGKMGLIRNLTAAEIIDQIRAISADLRVRMGHGGKDSEPPRPPSRGYISNVVFMGMGEPLHNFNETRRAVEILTDPEAFGFSTRHVTVSTCGLIPEIKKFGELVTAKLAISLNATDDETRSRIMPVNRKYPLAELMAAMRSYPLKPAWRITFEYVLLGGLNDSEADARRLARLISGLPAKVNLIVYNPHPASNYSAPAAGAVERFHAILIEKHVTVFIRESRGNDIAAACGQLGGTAQQ